MLAPVRSLFMPAVLLVMIFLFSCQTTKSIGTTIAPKKEPKVALVLGGGSSKGFAHVGVIRVLEQEKIPVDMIVGTSVGSLIGSIYASNPDGFQLEWLAFKIEKSDILDFSIVYSKMGPVQGAKLESFVERNVAAKRIEDTKIPFFPVATDLNTGETVILEKGSVARAVHASCAIPGIFAPVTFDKRMLVDGGVTDNVACDIARKKGADIIIGVSLQKDVKNYQIDSAIDVIAQAVNIMAREASRPKLECADVIIEPDVHGVPLFDFGQKKLMMEEGIKATRQAVPKIKELLAKFR